MTLKKMMKLFGSSSVYINDADEELMKLIQTDNNSDAFEELYRRYKTPIYSYLVYQTDVSIAEDLIQEIFIKVIKFKASFKYESKFKTWIWSITRNHLTDYYRSNDHKLKTSFDDILTEEGEECFETEIPSQEELILEKTTKEQLKICLGALPAEYKEAVLLSVESELSNAEIAKMMGLSVGAVKSILFRAKEKLTRCFKLGGHL